MLNVLLQGMALDFLDHNLRLSLSAVTVNLQADDLKLSRIFNTGFEHFIQNNTVKRNADRLVPVPVYHGWYFFRPPQTAGKPLTALLAFGCLDCNCIAHDVSSVLI